MFEGNTPIVFTIWHPLCIWLSITGQCVKAFVQLQCGACCDDYMFRQGCFIHNAAWIRCAYGTHSLCWQLISVVNKGSPWMIVITYCLAIALISARICNWAIWLRVWPFSVWLTEFVGMAVRISIIDISKLWGSWVCEGNSFWPFLVLCMSVVWLCHHRFYFWLMLYEL